MGSELIYALTVIIICEYFREEPQLLGSDAHRWAMQMKWTLVHSA